MRVLLIQPNQEQGMGLHHLNRVEPLGGVGEKPFLLLAPAILTAIIPVTPERMWRALHEVGEGHD